MLTGQLGWWGHTVGWTAGLVWLAIMCLWNSVRCQRVHCMFTATSLNRRNQIGEQCREFQYRAAAHSSREIIGRISTIAMRICNSPVPYEGRKPATGRIVLAFPAENAESGTRNGGQSIRFRRGHGHLLQCAVDDNVTNKSSTDSITFTSKSPRKPSRYKATNTGSPLAPGRSCKVEVVFHPLVTGKVNDHNARRSPPKQSPSTSSSTDRERSAASSRDIETERRSDGLGNSQLAIIPIVRLLDSIRR